MGNIIDGKLISSQIRDEIAENVKKLKRKPGLAVIIVGEDPASQIYVRNKEKACEQVGFYSKTYRLNQEATTCELLNLINVLNFDDKIDGILVQLPLPKHIDEKAVIEAIKPEKDVDTFSEKNTGKIMIGTQTISPCTPSGIIELLKRYNIDICGKTCVVVGRSNIVGKPMAMLLLQENGTVTICHSKTENLKEITKTADILVVAIGKSKFITRDMIKNNAVIIDVGMNRDENGKLSGDVDFENVKDIVSYITPVPGGVGPMTITMLLKNTFMLSLKNQNSI